MITRHRAVRVLRPLDPCARRFGCDVKDTLNLDSEQVHEIEIWADVIGWQGQSSFFFESPVYMAFEAHGKGYCLFAGPPHAARLAVATRDGSLHFSYSLSDYLRQLYMQIVP